MAAAANPELKISGSMLDLGDFELDLTQATVGTSCFSNVYVGRDKRNNKDVAVKVVDPTKGTEEEREAIEQKAGHEVRRHRHMIDEKINHANLVAVYAVMMIQHILYITMELGTLGNLDEFFKLNERLCSNSIDILRTKVGYMKDTVSGLAYLHSRNIVHRDLNPYNILITGSGAKICDFGLIKVLTTQPDGTSDHELMSDLGYRFFQAPEFFKDTVRYGVKSDVFSLGLIFTAMIQALPKMTLMPAAEGCTTDCLTTIGMDLLENPRLVILLDKEGDHDLVKELKQLICKMLHPSPDARPTSAELESEFVGLLKKFDDLQRAT